MEVLDDTEGVSEAGLIVNVLSGRGIRGQSKQLRVYLIVGVKEFLKNLRRHGDTTQAGEDAVESAVFSFLEEDGRPSVPPRQHYKPQPQSLRGVVSQERTGRTQEYIGCRQVCGEAAARRAAQLGISNIALYENWVDGGARNGVSSVPDPMIHGTIKGQGKRFILGNVRKVRVPNSSLSIG